MSDDDYDDDDDDNEMMTMMIMTMMMMMIIVAVVMFDLHIILHRKQVSVKRVSNALLYRRSYQSILPFLFSFDGGVCYRNFKTVILDNLKYALLSLKAILQHVK